MLLCKCQVPGCEYLATFITNQHYETEHQLTRSEAKTKYGSPKLYEPVNQKLKMNKPSNSLFFNENIVHRTIQAFKKQSSI